MVRWTEEAHSSFNGIIAASPSVITLWPSFYKAHVISTYVSEHFWCVTVCFTGILHCLLRDTTFHSRLLCYHSMDVASPLCPSWSRLHAPAPLLVWFGRKYWPRSLLGLFLESFFDSVWNLPNRFRYYYHCYCLICVGAMYEATIY